MANIASMFLCAIGVGGLLGALSLESSEPASARAATGCSYLTVHDGDTIRCGAERIRLANIDAPELPDSPKCEDRRRAYAWCDYQLGYQSRDALRAFLAKGRVAVSREGTDKYGRTLATISVNGQDAGEHLVALRLARPWQ